jgi:hypothetical protein
MWDVAEGLGLAALGAKVDDSKDVKVSVTKPPKAK